MRLQAYVRSRHGGEHEELMPQAAAASCSRERFLGAIKRLTICGSWLEKRESAVSKAWARAQQKSMRFAGVLLDTAESGSCHRLQQ